MAKMKVPEGPFVQAVLAVAGKVDHASVSEARFRIGEPVYLELALLPLGRERVPIAIEGLSLQTSPWALEVAKDGGEYEVVKPYRTILKSPVAGSVALQVQEVLRDVSDSCLEIVRLRLREPEPGAEGHPPLIFDAPGRYAVRLTLQGVSDDPQQAQQAIDAGRQPEWLTLTTRPVFIEVMDE